GGTILFPLSYIFGDILTEVYGYAQSRKVIWTGFFMILLASVVFIVVGALKPSPDWNGQAAYDQILGLTPRIVVASITAYFAGEFSNSYILAKMKIWMKGKFLWMRTIGSTLVGEAFDTTIFIMLAFFGVEGFSNELLLTLIISNYVFKVLVEILFTPITYAATRFLKKREEEDHFDHGTNFNPFKIG
ncbi:MAG: queuosine precursor transporter, partial [Candidatus Gracilibacteria bacterium]